MNSAKIRDRISWGHNIAGRVIGDQADAYRPKDAREPLALANRYLRLHAAFSPSSGGFLRPQLPGGAFYQGYFDTAYTRAGDYLVQNDRIFFIAEQDSLLPTLCIRTNSRVSISRTVMSTTIEAPNYGGATETITLLSGWPVSALGAGGGGQSQAGLPEAGVAPSWTVWMPRVPGVELAIGDVLADELERTAKIIAVELTHHGWRVIVRQVTT